MNDQAQAVTETETKITPESAPELEHVSESEIERKLAEYRARLETPAVARHRKTLAEKLATSERKLERTRVRLDRNDRLRAAILLAESQLHLKRGDLQHVYACALELAHLCRVHVLGLDTAYQVQAYPSYPQLPGSEPPPALGTGGG